MFGGGLGDVEDDPEGDEPEVDEPEGVVGAVSVVVVVLGALVVSGLVVLVGSLVVEDGDSVRSISPRTPRARVAMSPLP